jgi:hypothetical protein
MCLDMVGASSLRTGDPGFVKEHSARHFGPTSAGANDRAALLRRAALAEVGPNGL